METLSGRYAWLTLGWMTSSSSNLGRQLGNEGHLGMKRCVSVLGLRSSIWQRWSDERGAGQGACDFKAVTILVLISLEGEQLNLLLCAN